MDPYEAMTRFKSLVNRRMMQTKQGFTDSWNAVRRENPVLANRTSAPIINPLESRKRLVNRMETEMELGGDAINDYWKGIPSGNEMMNLGPSAERLRDLLAEREHLKSIGVNIAIHDPSLQVNALFKKALEKAREHLGKNASFDQVWDWVRDTWPLLFYSYVGNHK